MTDQVRTLGFADLVNPDIAIKRVYRNIVRGSRSNRLDASIAKQFPEEIKRRVTELLNESSMEWANRSASFFDLPRRDKLVRPICYLDLDVSVAYQALVDKVSEVVEPYIQSHFNNIVLSHRLRSYTSELMFRDPKEAFGKFIELHHQQA